MNFWRATTRNISLEEREKLIAAGKLSKISLFEPFLPLDEYPEEFRNTKGFENIPALSRNIESTGAVNFNHFAYIKISDQYMKDSLYTVFHKPKAFIKGLARAWFAYFKSTGSDYTFPIQPEHFPFMSNLYDYMFYGKLPYDLAKIESLPIYTTYRSHYIYIFLLIGLPFLFLYGLYIYLKSDIFNSSQKIVILFLCFNIAYMALIGNTFESGENNRFRFKTDPFSLILLGIFIDNLIIVKLKYRWSPLQK
jgi:hypothetical protein